MAARSLKEDRTRIARICQAWGEMPISTINFGHIESWLAKNKRKSKWSSATRNRYLSAINQVFKKAHGLHYLAENPVIWPAYWSTRASAWANCTASGGKMSIPLAGALTFTRPSQSGPSRKAIIWPDDSSPSAVVIPPIDIKKSLISAAKNIGAGHIHPHQFRHTCATRLKDQGAPMEHIMALGGWKSSMTAKRYARVNPVHLLQQHADRLEERPGHTPDDTKSKPTLP